MYKTFITSILAISLISISIIAQANQDNAEDSSAIGKRGDPEKVSRTIEISMIDNRFKPAEIRGGFKFEVQQLMVAWCSTSPLRIILHAVIFPQALFVAGG